MAAGESSGRAEEPKAATRGLDKVLCSFCRGEGLGQSPLPNPEPSEAAGTLAVRLLRQAWNCLVCRPGEHSLGLRKRHGHYLISRENNMFTKHLRCADPCLSCAVSHPLLSAGLLNCMHGFWALYTCPWGFPCVPYLFGGFFPFKFQKSDSPKLCLVMPQPSKSVTFF